MGEADKAGEALNLYPINLNKDNSIQMPNNKLKHTQSFASLFQQSKYVQKLC